jgi:hypothetical protein
MGEGGVEGKAMTKTPRRYRVNPLQACVCGHVRACHKGGKCQACWTKFLFGDFLKANCLEFKARG